MGTKNNPGKFDCYAKAEPDEPFFTLLGRDIYAPSLVDLWANQAEVDNTDPAKVQEARDCATAMRQWAGIERPVLSLRLTNLFRELDREIAGAPISPMAARLVEAMRSMISKYGRPSEERAINDE